MLHSLKQLTIAMHNYHETHNSFPPGWLSRHPTDPSGGESWGWAPQLITFIDANNWYAEVYAPRQFPPDAGHEYDTSISLFLCPTAESPPTNPHYHGYATANYAAVNGGNLGHVSDESPSRANGIFGENSTISFDQITDGTANTLLFGERRMHASGAAAGIWMRSINHDGTAGDGTAVAGVCHRDAMLNDFTNPDAFSSAHDGGAHFAFADCSTRFISQNIAPEVYERLAGINDGVVDKDF